LLETKVKFNQNINSSFEIKKDVIGYIFIIINQTTIIISITLTNHHPI